MAIFQFLPPFDRENYLGKSGDIVKETTLGILYRVLCEFKENKRVRMKRCVTVIVCNGCEVTNWDELPKKRPQTEALRILHCLYPKIFFQYRLPCSRACRDNM